MDCIVLAGGVPKPGEALHTFTKGAPKALLPVAGRPLGQWVLDALTEASSIGRLVVAGVEEGLVSPKLYRSLPDQGGIVDNLMAGLEALDAEAGGRIAVCTSDVPLLTGAMVDWFVANAASGDAVGGLIERAGVVEYFPDYPNTYWRLTDGRFTGADFAVFDPAVTSGRKGRFAEFAAARKSTLRMARLVGWRLLAGYVTRRLAVDDARRLLSRSVGFDVVLLDVPFPEMGIDVDLPEHLGAVERSLSG